MKLNRLSDRFGLRELSGHIMVQSPESVSYIGPASGGGQYTACF